MSRVIDSRHWLEGGTFVTNLSGATIADARAASVRFGDPEIIVLPYSESPAPRDYGGCLHWLAETRPDRGLSDFWSVVDVIREERLAGEEETHA